MSDGAVRVLVQRPRLMTWLREPLLHFLAAGLLLFAGYRLLHPMAEPETFSRRIELTAAELRQMEEVWVAQWRRAPTPEERRELLESRVRDEILYREALALGLDQGDAIVKRRLAQKLEFLSEDLASLRDPGIEELRAWFEDHAQRFVIPARVSFHHVYFSFDTRGADARGAAERALIRVGGQAADSAAARSLADPFMYQDRYRERSAGEVAGIFGPLFADALFGLRPGLWQGPIESGYGWHLVWIDQMAPDRVPVFEEVEAQVRLEWMEEQRNEARRQVYQAMRSRYEVKLPDGWGGDVTP